jgi:hypothetical protein
MFPLNYRPLSRTGIAASTVVVECSTPHGLPFTKVELLTEHGVLKDNMFDKIETLTSS